MKTKPGGTVSWQSINFTFLLTTPKLTAWENCIQPPGWATRSLRDILHHFKGSIKASKQNEVQRRQKKHFSLTSGPQCGCHSFPPTEQNGDTTTICDSQSSISDGCGLMGWTEAGQTGQAHWRAQMDPAQKETNHMATFASRRALISCSEWAA